MIIIVLLSILIEQCVFYVELFCFSYTFVFVFLSVVTGDVQDIDVCLHDSTFIIHCIYIPGSTICGCGYTLVHREGVANISGQILRTNGRGGHVKVNQTADYLEIVVYDMPTRENLSNIGIPIVKSLRGLSSCPTTENRNTGGTSHLNSRLKCCLGSGIFTSAVERGIAPHTRKQRVLAAISKLRSAYFTGYKNKNCTYCTYYNILEKWFPFVRERAHS